MKIVKVSYVTQAGFSEQNQNNIKTVMNDLRKLNYPGIYYHACLGADGKTFTHTAFYQSDEDQKLLSALDSFKHFQEQLKASVPEIAPKPEVLTLVGSSVDIFRG